MSFAPDLLEGRVALVTGASRGLGLHFASVLARHGAHVVLAARDASALEQARATITEAGGRAHAVRLDVTDGASVREALAEAARSVGVPTIVVNNSGIAEPRRLFDTTDEDFEKVLGTNLTGAFRVARDAARAMADAGVPGSIVNVGSIVGLVPAGQLAAYAASKAGLLHLTRTLAVELARHRIRVNALAPGYFETDMNRTFFATPAGEAMRGRMPMRRLGRVAELDGPLLLLASELSSFVTGHVLTVDGGHSIHPL